MAVTINGSTGIAGVDGSAGTPAVQGADANTGVFFPAADTIAFAEGGVEVARFNADAQFVVAAGTASLPVITTTGDTNTGIFFPAADTIAFTEGGAESARIDSSGNFLVGTTSGISYATRLTLSTDSGTNKWAVGPYATSSAFIIAANTSFGVYLPTTSATSWSSASDERLKENLVEITGAVSKIASLRAVTGNYISDETKTAKPFLIAQDVQSVLPEAVTVMPDGEHLGISYTDVVPLLVAAIKEQQALITSLTARIAALEGAAQ